MKKNVLSLCICLFTFSITAQITGTVSDEIGPLAFANISIKNSTKGTVSNDRGRFSIAAHPGDTLAISFVGYITKEIVINNQKVLDITLEGEVLDEVVLTSYYSRTESITICCRNVYSLCGTRSCIPGVEIASKNNSLVKSVTNTLPLLYPNPSSDGHFKLRIPNNYKEVQLYITNINGQQLQSTNYQNIHQAIRVDLSKYPVGIYLINLIADGERLPTHKAIKR